MQKHDFVIYTLIIHRKIYLQTNQLEAIKT